MEPQTASIGMGLVISLLFTEFFGLAAGGMIVPGYFALFLNQPLAILATLLAALLTLGLAKLVARQAIVYGRRRIVLTMLLGFLAGSALRWLSQAVAGGLEIDAVCQPFPVIGFIIPGLIALWMDRQGIWETVATLITASVVVRLTLIFIGLETIA